MRIVDSYTGDRNLEFGGPTPPSPLKEKTMNETNEHIGDFLGYIKLYRSFTSWEWYDEPITKSVFLHLILSANYEDKEWHGVTIKRGQFVTSYERLAGVLGLSVRNVRTALKNLISTGEIIKKATNKYTLITICNFDKYQNKEEEADKQTTNKRQTNDKQTTTTKEYKEYKEIYTAAANARTRTREGPEVRPIQEYIEEIKGDRLWLEAVCMNNRIKPDQIDGYINAFLLECTANGKEMHINATEAKSHFNSWLRIRKEIERKQQKQNESNNGNIRSQEDPRERVERLLNGDFRS